MPYGIFYCQEAIILVGSTVTTKSACFQTEYMGTILTKITSDGVPVDISEDRLGVFFAQYAPAEEVNATVSKSRIATVDFVLQVTLTMFIQKFPKYFEVS